jgi:hypothetical protein
MALRVAQPLRFRFTTRVLRAGGGGDDKPRWTLPAGDYHKFTYQPSIPDKHFNVAHWNYAPFTMWLRARRPAIEKLLGDGYSTLVDTAQTVLNPIQAVVDKNLPGFGYKVLGIIGLLLGYNISVLYVTKRTEAWMFLEKMRLYAVGDELVKQGFFMSDHEDAETKQHDYEHTTHRLEHLWEHVIAEATEARSFDKLVAALEVDEGSLPLTDIPKPISWRFSMMPYGRDDPDTKTTGFSAVDTPKSGVFEMLPSGDSGDYIDRQDNKPNPIRKARHMYTAAYLPPTK